jgi:ribosomal RNA-processing protein 9
VPLFDKNDALHLQVWNTLKKKPVSIARNAHSPQDPTPAAAAAADGAAEQPPAAGSWATAGVDTPGWVQSVAVAPLSNLVASGAGDGFIRLWEVTPNKHGGAGVLKQVSAGPG